MFGRPLSPEELELTRSQIESMDKIDAVSDEVRGIVERIGRIWFQSFRRRTNDIEATMDILARLKSLFTGGPVEPAYAQKLNAGSEAALAASIEGLRPGERAWITFEEGRALFSEMDDEYAFGEFDEPGKLNLGAFAAAHRVDRDFRPIEGRIYFIRRAN
jgi:hypothetical protein